VARRALVIREQFEPGRLAAQHLRLVYETVVPIRRARVREESSSKQTESTMPLRQRKEATQ
jgi:hypothetical protein